MGGLYGSEYWTYLLPRRVGDNAARRLTRVPFTAVGAREAVQIGLLDAAFGATVDSFRGEVRRMAQRLAADRDIAWLLGDKRRRRADDERVKPLVTYRKEELVRSHACFFGPDRSYHEARRRFVYKTGAASVVPTVPATVTALA
jgi:putative two-component system hydrogenase maturation factor HypX/HoxX